MTGLLITRAEWGARPARGGIGTIAPEGITVHYNGPAFGGFPWDHGRCAQMVRGTQAFHLDGRGWADIAYTACVCPHGFVFEGRGTRQRTAAQGTNDGNRRSLALMFLAGEGEPATDEARAVFEAKKNLRLLVTDRLPDAEAEAALRESGLEVVLCGPAIEGRAA